MEVSEKHNFIWLVVASTICAGLAVLVYFPFLLPAVIVIVWLKFRGSMAMVPYFIYLGISYLFSTVFSSSIAALGFDVPSLPVLLTVLFVCLTFPAAIISVLMHRSGRRMYESVLWTILASLCGVGAFVALVYIYTEQNLTILLLNALTQVLNTHSDFLSAYYDWTINFTQILSGTTATNISTTDAQKITYLTELASESLPVFLGIVTVSFSLLSGLFSYYLPYLFLKNKNVKLTPCPAFKDLRVPNPERVILIVVFLAASLVSMTNAYPLQIVASVLRAGVVLVFMVQGLSFLTYLFKNKRIGTGFFVFLIIVGFVFRVMFWLGLFEAVMNMRMRMDMLMKGGGE